MDFFIMRHEYFQFSEISREKFLHICLDNVYYPIDFKKLGIDSINLPVGLRFSLSDGIFPTPNREAIRYTQEAKDVIIKRLEQASIILLRNTMKLYKIQKIYKLYITISQEIENVHCW
jgi:hypothetical protein